jgi:hypothetical protein
VGEKLRESESEHGEARKAEHSELAQERPLPDARETHGDLIDFAAPALEWSGRYRRAGAK